MTHTTTKPEENQPPLSEEKESKTLEEEINNVLFPKITGDTTALQRVTDYVRSKLKAEAEKAWDAAVEYQTEAHFVKPNKQQFLSKYNKS